MDVPCLLVNNFVPIVFSFCTFSCNYADYVNRSSVRTDDRMSDVNQMISRGKDRDRDCLTSIYHCSITFGLASQRFIRQIELDFITCTTILSILAHIIALETGKFLGILKINRVVFELC